MKHIKKEKQTEKSIFSALFVPLFLIMILQCVIYYMASVYGGIDKSLRRNASDILTERVNNRRNEIETLYNGSWTELDGCIAYLNELYDSYKANYGARPFIKDAQYQIDFLKDVGVQLENTLRTNGVNGIFLILNDQKEYSASELKESEYKYGLCIRDLDPKSNYTGTEDLLLERSPVSLVDYIGCSLDSWWESKYQFDSIQDGDYYYQPLNAAWKNQGADSSELAYFSGAHKLNDSDQSVVSCSVPLISQDGYPFGVLGIEVTTQYLASLMPNKELNEADKCCYVLAMRDVGSTEYTPIVGTGALYSRCFGFDSTISCKNKNTAGGFTLTGRDGTELYGQVAQLDIYNNNSPFEDQELVLIAMVDSKTMFSYNRHIKLTLLVVSGVSLLIGIIAIIMISHHFAFPITSLAKRVKKMKPETGFELGRIGITEIDQLVNSIETLNKDVSNNVARTEFFSRMSHDMRTPMNAIISFSSTELLEVATDVEKDDYFKKIHDSGEYLLGLINEVLDMTKIESNKTELHFETVKTEELWRTTLPIIDELAHARNVNFSKNINICPKQYVIADKQRLDQIVMNLLSNSVKFTAEGGTVSLNVDIENNIENTEALHCKIVVGDTGIGMSKEFMSRMYTPFVQENSGREGTGLGLSIVKSLVELMGGTIDCESEKDVGTTFTINLELKKAASPNGQAVEQNEKSDEAYLRGKRILICEDHPLNTQIARRLLEKEGMIVEAAENGKIGVDMFVQSDVGYFDAVLMDIRMPVMGGLETAKTIRALERADAKTIPIIAMTANAFDEDMRASSAVGMNVHLSKPIEPLKLYAALKEQIKIYEHKR